MFPHHPLSPPRKENKGVQARRKTNTATGACGPQSQVAGVASTTGALWGLLGELLVLVVVLCWVSSKMYTGLTQSADMVICLPRQ